MWTERWNGVYDHSSFHTTQFSGILLDPIKCVADCAAVVCVCVMADISGWLVMLFDFSAHVRHVCRISWLFGCVSHVSLISQISSQTFIQMCGASDASQQHWNRSVFILRSCTHGVAQLERTRAWHRWERAVRKLGRMADVSRVCIVFAFFFPYCLRTFPLIGRSF